MRYAIVPGLVLLLAAVGSNGSAQESAPTATPTQIVAEPAKQPASDAVATLTRMELCASIADRQPVDTATSFPATQEKVFCFLEFGGGKNDTTVTVVWKLGVQEMGRIPLNIRRYPMFRTWANKSIYGMKGNWSVQVLDEKGNLIQSAAFTVQ